MFDFCERYAVSSLVDASGLRGEVPGVLESDVFFFLNDSGISIWSRADWGVYILDKIFLVSTYEKSRSVESANSRACCELFESYFF